MATSNIAQLAPLQGSDSSLPTGTNVTTVLQAKSSIFRTPGALANVHIDILILIMCELDFVSAVCFGITCAATNVALKKKHPGPIDLMAFRGHVIHKAFCPVGFYNNWSGKLTCDCLGNPLERPVFHTLAHFLTLTTTFATFQLAENSQDYRLSRNRGDCRWVFVNKSVYGERDPGSDKIGLEKIMDNRYRVYALFRRFNAYVMKGSTVRLPSYDCDKSLRNRQSLIPSPFGLSYENWIKAVVKAMIEDMKNWGGSREGWMSFWKEQARYFEESDVFTEHEQELVKAADEYDWPAEVDKNQAALTSRFVEQYIRKYQHRVFSTGYEEWISGSSARV